MRLVWSGFKIDPDGDLLDPEEGSIMGGVSLEVIDGDGGKHVFETMDDDVEWAANCIRAIEEFVQIGEGRDGN